MAIADVDRDQEAPSAPRPGPSRSPARRLAAAGRDRSPGLALALAGATVATAAGHAVPLVGGPVLGIVLGVATAAVVRPGERLRPGLAVASRPVLQAAIVVLGGTLSLQQVVSVGGASLPVMLGTLAVALLGASVLGRLLGVGGDAGLLIGVGTAICGASAIAAVQSVVRAREDRVAYAIGTIFVFNIAAVLAFPPLGHLLGLDPHAFGLWAGTAINDTSSVVAAGYAYGGDAGSYAVVVKLVRSLMIVPVVLALGVWTARRRGDGGSGGGSGEGSARPSWSRLVPPFLIGFVIASGLRTVGVVPASWQAGLTVAGTFLITAALAGIGLALRPADLRRAGVRPLLLGAALWVLVGASSLGLQALTGTL